MQTDSDQKPRTMAQNRALHLMFANLADQLNKAGFDMRKTLKNDVEIPWSKYTVKEFIWRPIMKAQLGKTSTTQLTTSEVNEVFRTIERHMAQKLGIELEFPSIEALMMHERTSVH